MKRDFLKYIVCPTCKEQLSFSGKLTEEEGRIKNGKLICSKCAETFPIIRFIPRFVSRENYAQNFGLEWKKHYRTQYDSETKTSISKDRFFNQSRWSKSLLGELMLEVGSGSGRFTEIAAQTKAMVVSVDYSIAVESNYYSNGNNDNVFIIQADIYNLPFRLNYFDKVFCFGVLQHTPNVEKSFHTLPNYLKSGGQIAIDVYKKPEGLARIYTTKYWVRPITKRIPAEKLYTIVVKYINFMWRFVKKLNHYSFGDFLIHVFLISDYSRIYPLSEKMLKEWAILDTYDMLSPIFDSPQTLKTVQKWFQRDDLKKIHVAYVDAGVVGRAVKK